MRRIHFAILLASISFIITGCAKKKEKSTKPIVMVSIQPLKYFVDRIADSTILVKVMVPQGSSPEMYEPTPGQMAELNQAKGYFAIGLIDFEMGMQQKLADNAQFKYVNLSQGVDLIKGECNHEHGDEDEEGHHHAVDPHIWMSTVNAKVMANSIAKNLTMLFPDKEKVFSENLSSFLQEIDSIDQAIRSIVEKSGRKSFIIYHPALSYFARDFGLTQLSIEHEGKNPSAKGVMEVVEHCRNEGITTILSQSQFDTHNSQTIANEIGGTVIKVDPLQENWANSMIHIANAIAGNRK
ncbi:MAG: zinc transport system substrate-binding protein [Tenuifilum sp.]|jgi:zinc transport system substrate-binding protein|uniref:metal ABC transporter solute-binding protein, Zn/Mn family n=1 Tax=Tenuifilum sp. TaxID=2760880 RepID=UPI0024AC2C31|nr:zinc ABC transporter substrate-binding protein [Tenuifilum sp.]MDI3525933.1 zinc transport system substrate-binding protein [Tenuifilum sp.]